MSGHEEDFLFIRGLVAGEVDVFKMNFHGWSGVELKGEKATVAEVLGVIVDELGGGDAVDFLDDMVAPGDDFVGIPVALFEGGFDLVRCFREVSDGFFAVLADDRFFSTMG